MRQKLRAPLPAEAITKHPTKTYLSSIKAIYVIERLNDVFGVGSFTLKSNMVERGEAGTVVTKTILEIPEYGVYLESFGGNDNGGENSKNFDLGDAYKGSVTDAITKICSYLEIAIDVFKGGKKPETPAVGLKPPAKAEPKAPAKKETPTKTVVNNTTGTMTVKNDPAMTVTNTAKAEPKTKALPELLPTDKQWNHIVKRMAEGTKIDTIKTHFSVSRDNTMKLMKDMEAYVKANSVTA